jgi:hypothetical protein
LNEFKPKILSDEEQEEFEAEIGNEDYLDTDLSFLDQTMTEAEFMLLSPKSKAKLKKKVVKKKVLTVKMTKAQELKMKKLHEE